jgi:hypothetical protein
MEGEVPVDMDNMEEQQQREEEFGDNMEHTGEDFGDMDGMEGDQ